jgi:hypothetical protein
MQERVADLLAVEARTKTEVKQAKRREQNRIAARISRARKKGKLL